MTLLPELELGQSAEPIAVQREVATVQYLHREVIVDTVREFIQHRPVEVLLLEGLLRPRLSPLDEVGDLDEHLSVIYEVASRDVLPYDLLELLIPRVLALITVVGLVHISVQEQFELE